MKTAWILKHVPFEGPGAIGPWLTGHGYRIQTHSWWESTPPPAVEAVDLVIAMGGPMSINDEEEYPWLVDEKAWVREALHREVPLLGVCLGAQIMAAALGASVGPNPVKEIGWFPLQAVEPGVNPPTVLHWHGERFDLPEGATLVSGSKACDHQDFRWGSHARGLQYHLEATEDSLEALIKNCRHELTPGPYVQTEAELREGWRLYHAAAQAELDRILRDITRA